MPVSTPFQDNSDHTTYTFSRKLRRNNLHLFTTSCPSTGGAGVPPAMGGAASCRALAEGKRKNRAIILALLPPSPSPGSTGSLPVPSSCTGKLPVLPTGSAPGAWGWLGKERLARRARPTTTGEITEVEPNRGFHNPRSGTKTRFSRPKNWNQNAVFTCRQPSRRSFRVRGFPPVAERTGQAWTGRREDVRRRRPRRSPRVTEMPKSRSNISR